MLFVASCRINLCSQDAYIEPANDTLWKTDVDAFDVAKTSVGSISVID